MIARLHKAMEEREEGFTLIELLVVMIGILAAIAIPLFLSQRQKGYDASIKSDLRTIANEMESVYTDTQAYPFTAGATSATLGPTTVTVGTDTVRTSPGNTFTVSENAAGSAYCIVGSNTNATHSWVYVSSQGGLQPSTVTSCPGSY